MKVFLVHPYLESILSRKFALHQEEPIGLEYIASSLINSGHEVKILDMNIFPSPIEKFKNILKIWNPEIVGISCYTSSFSVTKLLAKLTKQVNSKIKVVVGGPHITHLPIQTLKEIKEIDIGVIGEGENTMREIVNNVDLKKVRGIVFRKKQIFLNKPRKPIENLDKIPFPARELVDLKKYYDWTLRKPTALLLTSRGCPYECAFCSKIFFKVRFRSVQSVIEEWKELVEKFKVGSIFIADDIFTLNKKRAIEICKNIIKERLTISWSCQSRVDTINKGLISMMAKAGCKKIWFGIESASQRSLDELNKKTTIVQIKKALKITKDAGIDTCGFFILGTINETRKDLYATLKFIREEKNLDFLSLHILQPFPGSKIFSFAKKEGRLMSEDWDKIRLDIHEDSILKLNYLTNKDLKKWKRRMMLSFYSKPKFLIKRLNQFLNP